MVMEERSKTRKPHRKSRNGCVPCKARHVKCDETRPICVNCQKYSATCEFPLPKVRSRANIAGDQATTGTLPLEPSAANIPPFDSNEDELKLDTKQLRLLHNFTTRTVASLGVSENVEEVLRTFVVDIAFDFPYLLHAILGLAALHLNRAGTSQGTEYWRLAERHHAAAIARFRSDVQDFDETNFEAVYGFAFLIAPLATGLVLGTYDNPEKVLSGIIDNLKLAHMTGPMVRLHYSRFLESRLSCFITPDLRTMRWDETYDPQREPVSLNHFIESVRFDYPPETIEAYEGAISGLQSLFKISRESSKSPSPSLSRLWVHKVPPHFLQLLTDMQPGALIILAHYAVLLYMIDHIWYVHGSPGLLVHAVEKLVPTAWRPWLDWPKQRIFGNLADHDMTYGTNIDSSNENA